MRLVCTVSKTTNDRNSFILRLGKDKVLPVAKSLLVVLSSGFCQGAVEDNEFSLGEFSEFCLIASIRLRVFSRRFD